MFIIHLCQQLSGAIMVNKVNISFKQMLCSVGKNIFLGQVKEKYLIKII